MCFVLRLDSFNVGRAFLFFAFKTKIHPLLIFVFAGSRDGSKPFMVLLYEQFLSKNCSDIKICPFNLDCL